MYVDTSSLRKGDTTYTRYLLRESYRVNGKVKHRTLANLSRCSAEEIQAIKLALRHKAHLSELQVVPKTIALQQGPAFGAVWLLVEMARSLGIQQALGNSREGKLALWQAIARVLDQGSRLSAVRLAGTHAASEVLSLGHFDEDDLYANLDWLTAQQAEIEQRLFQQQEPAPTPGLFLYDVTSSYLEGQQNALGAFGYNRDGKRGKRQIVIGLLCNGAGRPLSIEVFAGNTPDPKTFASQLDKVAQRFGGGDITFVGDRGMIKGPQIETLGEQQCHYITAITKPQIETLLVRGTLQLGLFDEDLTEVLGPDGVRYILRRNPIRADEIARSRDEKYQTLTHAVEVANSYLIDHPRAQPDIALRKLSERARRLHIDAWITLTHQDRTLRLVQNTTALAECAQLDGCYVLKTDLAPTAAPKELVHQRYKDLALVEWAFRESKTAHLEMRPLYVRLESRTRGHAFVVMLAYLLIQELAQRWRHLNLTVQEGLDQLATLCLTEVHLPNQPVSYQLPTPRDSLQSLLEAAHVKLPHKLLPRLGQTVTTKTKLTERRKNI